MPSSASPLGIAAYKCLTCGIPETKERAEFIPVPFGAGEEGVDGVVVHLWPQAGELPDLGEGATAQTENPGHDHRLEDGKGLPPSETAAKKTEQFGQRYRKMLHGWTLLGLCGLWPVSA